MNSGIRIADKFIGHSHAPFVIAEMSGNHNQSLARALETVEVASNTGAHGYVTRPLIRIGAMLSETSA